MTLSPGIRFEAFNTYVPAQGSPAGRFVPFREFDKIENLPNWRDVAPRLGVVYDVFNDGRTALKGHVGKYMRAFSTVGFAAVYNPMVIGTDRRTWSDPNGDDIAQDIEIGPVNTPFNVSGSSNRNPDPDIRRPYQWEYNLGIQREVVTGVSLSFNWVRREFHRLFWTDNVLVSPEDYTIVPVVNPLDPSETIPIYNLNLAKRGQVQQSGPELGPEPADLQRLRHRLHRARPRRQRLRRHEHRPADHGHLRGRGSEQPAVLRSP